MKFKIIVIFIIITFIYSIISANNIPRDYPDFKEIVQSTNNGLRAQAEQYKTWEEIFKETKDMDNYDVQYYKININVDFEEQFIFANITMRFEISEDNVNEIKLDFTDNLTIIGIQQDGDSLIYIHNDDVITIDLNGVYNIGELITLEIDYAGYPQNKLNDGLKFQSHSGTPVVFTMVSPKGARKWWPCKDTPADKPDSLDLWITYPDEYVCAANGLLMEQICNGDSTITDKWHESYPIATYLTSFAITNYDIFSQNYEYNSQIMPIDHYVYPEIYNTCVNLFSITPDMIDFFSTIYGEYPFLSEKYGHAVCTNLGALAMEHQTCTSYQSSYISDPGAESTVAHELSHQWAGDCLSIGSWAHVWLKEGFARYSEALWAEHLYGTQGLHDFMNNLDTGTDLDPCLYRDPDGSASHIFDIVIYSKGGWTMHMLRGVVGDSCFFEALYQLMQDPQYKYGNFLTNDLKEKAEDVSGMELDWFFNEWFYNEGRPSYRFATYTSEQEDSLIITTFSQGNLEDNFAMYVPINLNGIIYSIFADSGFSHHTLYMGDSMDSLIWDPDNWVLDYGYIEEIPELAEIEISKGAILLIWNEFFDPDIQGFNIYRKANGGEYIKINTTPVSGVSYFDEDVILGDEYFYKIAAVIDSSRNYISKFSNEVSGTPINFTLNEGILLVDETTQANPLFPSNSQIDTFYHYLVDGYQFTDWDVEDLGLPPLAEMAKYSSIIWHSDELFDSQFDDNSYSLKSYLLAGGNIFISGWKHLPSPWDLYEQYLHVTSPIYNSNADFTGSFGEQNYPELDIVEDKVPLSVWGDNLAYIYKLTPLGKAEPIYYFNSTSNDPDWENKICAIHYSGNYKLFLLGFPLYYTNIDGAKSFMTEVLDDFGEEFSTDTEIVNNHLNFKIYPNPSQNAYCIKYYLPKAQSIKIEIFNIKGQLIESVNERPKPAGEHTINLSTVNLESGVYFYKLSTIEESVIKKFINIP